MITYVKLNKLESPTIKFSDISSLDGVCDDLLGIIGSRSDDIANNNIQDGRRLTLDNLINCKRILKGCDF
jgi:hypothetical protein